MRIVITTLPAAAAAEIAGRLVEERLAACATLVPGALSIYRWKGEVERAEETVVALKTSESKASELSSRLRAIHPYEVPEILSVAPETVLAAYEAWVRESVEDPSAG